MDVRAPFRLLASLPEGVAGVPVGLPGMPYLSLPGAGHQVREAGGRRHAHRRSVAPPARH